MALGGILGGLANLGTVYGGYQQAQSRDLQNQINQLNLQTQMALDQAALPLARGGAFSPQTNTTNPLPQPTMLPGFTTPSGPPPYQPGQVTSTPLPAPLPQVPSYATAFDTSAAASPLASLQSGQFGGQFGSGLPSPQAQSQAPNYLSPPLAGLGTGLQAQAQPQLPNTPATDPRFALTGPPPNFGDLNLLTSTLDGGGPTLSPGGATGQSVSLVPQVPSPVTGADDPRTLGAPQQTAAYTPPTVPDQGTGGWAARPPTDTGAADQVVGTGAGGWTNPGNMKTASGGWMQFDSPQEGVAAIGDWLIRHNQEGQTTIRQLIDDPQRGYAPSSDPGNAGKNLPEAAARIVGVSPDQPIDMRDPVMRQRMVRAILQQEGAVRGSTAADAAHADMSRHLPPGYDGIGNAGAMMLMRMMPQLPQAVHAMDPKDVANLLDKALPGTSDLVKGAVLLKVMPFMNEQAKEATAEAWTGWNAQMKQLEFVQKEEDIAVQRQETAAYRNAMLGKGGQYFMRGDDLIRVDPQGGVSKVPIPGEGPVTKPGAARQGYQILTDPNTGTQFQQIPGRPETAIDMQGNPYKPTGAARLGAVGPGQARWSEDAMNSLVQQALSGDPSVMQRLPRSGPARQQFEEALAAHMKDLPGGIEGNTSTMMMNRIRMLEAQSAARTAGRVTMNTELFSQEAQLAGKNLIEVSREVPRTAYRPINELLLAYETNTGDPNVIKLGTAVNAVINAYGKMSNPTGTGIHDADKARISTILDRSLSQGQIEAGVSQIITEGRLVSQAAQSAQEAVLGRITPQAPGVTRPETTPSTSATPQTGSGTEVAIASMNRQQIQKFLQDNPTITDQQRSALAKRLDELDAQEGVGRPFSDQAPPVR